jgi:hypothetical protein
MRVMQVAGHQVINVIAVRDCFVFAAKAVAVALLAEEGHVTLSVLDAENGLSNAKTFTITESVRSSPRWSPRDRSFNRLP